MVPMMWRLIPNIGKSFLYEIYSGKHELELYQSNHQNFTKIRDWHFFYKDIYITTLNILFF